MTMTAYWWSPLRDPRSALSELRSNAQSWMRAAGAGGGLSNFGDELSAEVLSEATGRRVKWASIGQAEVIAVGSILGRYLAKGGSGFVWGAGLRDGSTANVDMLDPGKVLAVRGLMTRQHLSLPHTIAVGDPGLLAKCLVGPAKKRSGTLVVPHFTAFGTAEGRGDLRALRASGASVLSATAPTRKVCAAISAADHVVTSSLHGLVVADSLGIPVTLATIGPRREPDFKYQDYASVFVGSVSTVKVDDVVARTGSLRTALDEASARRDAITPQVDGIVDSLVKAVGPLRL